MASATAIFDPDNIIDLTAKALCTDGNQISLNSPYEGVAVVGHACMVAIGFRLVGLGEDHNIESPGAPSLPLEWNAGSTYAFRYAHYRSSMQYLLKVSRLGNNAVIMALALGDDKTSSFDIPIKDYISESALPVSTTREAANLSRLKEVFISVSRLSDLIGLFKINVIGKLAPGLYKEGYEDPSRAVQESREQRPHYDPLREEPQSARPHLLGDPLAAAPRPTPDFPPPGFENEHEINRPPRGYPRDERNPMNIGSRDLYPPGLGPNDPFRGTIGPSFGGGGMHPTFDDPLFGGRRDGGYDPQVPPGSRYDPVGPGEPPSGRGWGSFGGRGGPRGFGGGII